jgi:hypothetical protein
MIYMFINNSRQVNLISVGIEDNIYIGKPAYITILSGIMIWILVALFCQTRLSCWMGLTCISMSLTDWV